MFPLITISKCLTNKRDKLFEWYVFQSLTNLHCSNGMKQYFTLYTKEIQQCLKNMECLIQCNVSLDMVLMVIFSNIWPLCLICLPGDYQGVSNDRMTNQFLNL